MWFVCGSSPVWSITRRPACSASVDPVWLTTFEASKIPTFPPFHKVFCIYQCRLHFGIDYSVPLVLTLFYAEQLSNFVNICFVILCATRLKMMLSINWCMFRTRKLSLTLKSMVSMNGIHMLWEHLQNKLCIPVLKRWYGCECFVTPLSSYFLMVIFLAKQLPSFNLVHELTVYPVYFRIVFCLINSVVVRNLYHKPLMFSVPTDWNYRIALAGMNSGCDMLGSNTDIQVAILLFVQIHS